MNLAWTKIWIDDNFNRADLEGLVALYSPTAKFQDMTLGIQKEGAGGLREFFGLIFDPKAGSHQFQAEAYLGDARGGVVEWIWRGTMGSLDFLGIGYPVEGKSFQVRGNSVLRFDPAGLITEERDYWDGATVLRQLGALPKRS